MALFEGLSTKLQNITAKMRGKSRVTEQDIKDMMKEIRLALLEADVNYQVVKELTSQISEKCQGTDVMESLTPGQQVVKIVHDSLIEILSIGNTKLAISPSGFTVIMVYGLQGSGKTTFTAKLGKLLKSKGKKPILASVDTHRPAAALQLEVLGKAAGVPTYIEAQNKDAVSIARNAVDRARYLLCDTLIVDTAGRMTIDAELMDELKDISAVVKPTQRLLVVDAMIGQEAVNIAQEFDRQIGLDGYIMTKLDSDARGGAALSIAYITGKPIKFIGVGEKLDAIEEYHPDRMASRILGMGDVLSLIEKASASIDQREAEKTLNKLQQNRFSLQDMLEQFEQVKKMGSLKDIMGMIPGLNSKQVKDANLDDSIVDKQMAIIRSMTTKERENPSLLNASRRKRIALGSGSTVQQVNQLVNQYEQTNKMMKQMMGGMGTKGKRGRGGLGKGRFPF